MLWEHLARVRIPALRPVNFLSVFFKKERILFKKVRQDIKFNKKNTFNNKNNMTRFNEKQILTFLGFLLITFCAAFVGNFFTTSNISNWYIFLDKPFFSPPNWLFGPVWTILYFLMTFSAFLVWREKENSKRKIALIFYFIQLVLNSIWSIIFFGLKNLGLAFFEMLALWFFIFLTIIYFFRIKKFSGYLLLPYIFWVSFALILNLTIWLIN